MAYTTYTASQAVQRANAETSWDTGMCLEFVWHCIAEPVRKGLPDANAAWTAAKQKETTGTPPAGAPVYFKGFAHGHIALSLGGGFIRSTDWPTKGRVGRVNINDLCRDWYGTTANYLGWSRDYAGDPIRGLEETSTNYSPPPVLPQEDDMPTVDEVWAKKFASPTDGTEYAAATWLVMANVKAGEAKALASKALDKVNALAADRQALIADVVNAMLNAPVANVDPDPNDGVTPPTNAFRSYSVMANWRAAQLQGDVAALAKAVADLTAKVDALPKG